MEQSINPIHIVIKQGQGITQALLNHIKSDSDLKFSAKNLSSTQWQETIQVLKDINKNRTNGNNIFRNNNVNLVYTGDRIDFTEEETALLYKAMGFDVKIKKTEKTDDAKIDDHKSTKDDDSQVIEPSKKEDLQVITKPKLKNPIDIDSIIRKFENAPVDADGYSVITDEKYTKSFKQLSENEFEYRKFETERSYLPAEIYNIKLDANKNIEVSKTWNGVLHYKLSLTSEGNITKVQDFGKSMFTYVTDVTEIDNSGNITFSNKAKDSYFNGKIKLNSNNEIELLTGESQHTNSETNKVTRKKIEWNLNNKEYIVTDLDTGEISKEPATQENRIITGSTEWLLEFVKNGIPL